MGRPSMGGNGRKVTCECGAVISARHRASHERTQKHLAAVGPPNSPVGLLEDDPSRPEQLGDDEPRGERRATGGGEERPRVVAFPKGGRGSSAASMQAALDEAADITEWIQADLITTIEPAAPVVGEYWKDWAADNTRNWTIICRNHPGALKGTLKAADYVAYYGLAKFGTGLLVGLGVETGFLAADNRMAQMAGVTAAWERVMEAREAMAEEVYENYRAGEPAPDAEPAWPGLLGQVGS